MTIDEYCERLRIAGFRVVVGSEGTLWVSHERFSMVRQPACALHVPSREEIDGVFRQSHAAILSYAVRPSDVSAANSVLYSCTDADYSIEKLGKGARYDTRRGLNELDIRFLGQPEVVELGKQAYLDTLSRTGLSVDRRDKFEVVFGRPRPDRRYLGATKGSQLAAFLLVTEVNDSVSIVGGYSANEFLPLRPNNALVFSVLREYLVEKKIAAVSYGLSSVQAVSNAAGLHKFKLKMGFEATPVRRAFVVNPLFRPLVNRVSWRLVNGMLKLSPHHPMLKKAEGALRVALERYD